jgi:hypothetical protein
MEFDNIRSDTIELHHFPPLSPHPFAICDRTQPEPSCRTIQDPRKEKLAITIPTTAPDQTRSDTLEFEERFSNRIPESQRKANRSNEKLETTTPQNDTDNPRPQLSPIDMGESVPVPNRSELNGL